MNKTEIVEKIQSKVDYKVGDWVETCNFLPGIVQSIDIGYVKRDDYVKDVVEIFYPHMAFDKKYNGKYCGGSICSADNCGIHKITSEYACKLMALGYDRLSNLWERACEYWKTDDKKAWKDFVEEEYKKVFERADQ